MHRAHNIEESLQQSDADVHRGLFVSASSSVSFTNDMTRPVLQRCFGLVQHLNPATTFDSGTTSIPISSFTHASITFILRGILLSFMTGGLRHHFIVPSSPFSYNLWLLYSIIFLSLSREWSLTQLPSHEKST